MSKFGLIVVALGFAVITSCGGGSSSSSDGSSSDQSGTTYSGSISNSYLRTGAVTIQNQIAACVINGTITVTINADGTIQADTQMADEQITGVCDYVDGVVTAHWEGTASNGQFEMSATASSPNASAQNQMAGTYTDTNVSGAGSGSVTVTTPAGRTIDYAATYTFDITVVQ